MMRHNRLDQANRQCLLAAAYAVGDIFTNMSGMHDIINMQDFKRALQKAMDEKSIAPTTLSLEVGNNKSLVKSILEKGEDVSLSTINRLAKALGKTTIEILSGVSPAQALEAERDLAISDTARALAALLEVADVGAGRRDAVLAMLPSIAEAARVARTKGLDVQAYVLGAVHAAWQQSSGQIQ